MKKYFLLLVFFSVFLSGCSQSVSDDIDFSQNTKNFQNSIQKLQQNISTFSWDQKNQLKLTLYWDNNDFKLNFDLAISWFSNIFSWYFDEHSSFDLYFRDKREKNEQSISGQVLYKKTRKNKFLMQKNILFDIWKWNFQWDLLTLISQNLDQKRILLDQKTKDQTINIFDIFNTLDTPNVFQAIKYTSYEWYPAHKVSMDNEFKQKFFQDTSIQILDFDWTLVYKWEKQSLLKINSLTLLLNDKNIYLQWEISNNQIAFKYDTLSDFPNLQAFSILFDKKQTHISYHKNQNYQNIFEILLHLQNKKTPDNKTYFIDWELNISPMFVFGTDLEKDIKIDINGEYVFNHTSNVSFRPPDSYVFLQQILWDQFFFQDMINQNIY